MLAADISAGFVGWGIKLINGRIFVGLAAGPIVEHQQMAFAAKPFRNPLDVVLEEETLLEPGALVIDSRIAPAVEEIPAFAPTPAQMTTGFLGGGAMINNPDLVKVRTAQSELIQVGV